MLRKDDLGGGLYIWQDPEAFCFGIDAVLLAHFPEISAHERVCDLGCAYAPIPMILSGTYRDTEDLHITGIEIQEEIAETARRSVRENGLDERIRIITGDIREAATYLPAASFSLVISNPPYMAVSEGIVGGDRRRAIARSEICLKLEDVIAEGARLLKPRGRFAMIHRPYRLPEMLELMRKYRMEPKRMRFIHPTVEAEPTMVLIEAVRGGKPYLRVSPPLVIYDGQRNYTQEVREIYEGKRRS